ncbi:amino acid permease [Hoyosella altamirensis]|uniref:Amino acid transporter n=1 Tax=Hoyosella altamirensis TaxID=616997 RepID=A0A839RKR2_9ACTN|nr:amino acid permease [Hoyosella altamirensis]MBB3036977.1 amino acid transporter [Hoyosella altamirensis]
MRSFHGAASRGSARGRPPGQRPLGLFLVVMLMFGIITSLNGMSALATYGLGAVFYLGVAIVLFLIPAALVAAELGTSCQRDGGVYVWVSEAFGPRAGFVATWLQWFQNVVFWTVVLTGAAAMFALSLRWEAGAENKPYVAGLVVGTIWLVTVLSLRGLRSSGLLGTFGAIVGTIVPALVLVAFAAAYLMQDRPSNITGSSAELIPDLTKPANITFGLSAILIFAGIEVMATRIGEMRDPARVYPLATLVSVLMIAVLMVPATLAIAVLVPSEQINITAGIVQAMNVGVDHIWHIGWLVPLMALAIYVDAIGEIAGWMAATPSAMATAARDGHLPKRFAQHTARNAAKPVLIGQAVIGSLLSLLFIFQPSVASMFWLLSALLVQLYLIMYAMMFASALKLRKTQPQRTRPFTIPGGAWGVRLICGVGICFSTAGVIVGFFPPAGLAEATAVSHTIILVVAVLIGVLSPLAVSLLSRRRASG